MTSGKFKNLFLSSSLYHTISSITKLCEAEAARSRCLNNLLRAKIFKFYELKGYLPTLHSF